MKKFWDNTYFNLIVLFILIIFFSGLTVYLKALTLQIEKPSATTAEPSLTANQEVESDQEKYLRLTKNLESEKLQPSIKPDFYQLLITRDEERGNPEICGYNKSAFLDLLHQKITRSVEEPETLIINSGLWSNNCKSFVFDVKTRNYYVDDKNNPQIGVWIYYPQDKNLFQLVKAKVGQSNAIYRFLSSNLVAIGDNVYDTRTRTIIDNFDNGYLQLRDRQFAWSLKFPSAWTYQLQDEKTVDADQDQPEFATIVFKDSKNVVTLSEHDLTTNLDLKLVANQQKFWDYYDEYKAEGRWETYLINRENNQLPKTIIVYNRNWLFSEADMMMNSIQPLSIN